MEKSKGGYFLHLDADMSLGKDAVKECVEKITENNEITALYIPEIVLGDKYFSKVRRFERSFYDKTVIDAVRFIRKDKFAEAGGFDEKLYAGEDWDLDRRLKKVGKFDIIKSPLYHNEAQFSLSGYRKKKKYYSQSLNTYIAKWGRNDSDIKKQFGFYYRYIGIFIENGKWKKLLHHPLLTFGLYFLRFLVGVRYLMR